jgi:hypothetical protein
MSKLTPFRRVLLTALSIQLVAVLWSFCVLYTCTSRGIPERNFSAAAYWSTIGLLGFMFLGLALPATLLVIVVMGALIMSGLSSKRVSFLWVVGLLLWGVYWILLAHEVCAPPPD